MLSVALLWSNTFEAAAFQVSTDPSGASVRDYRTSEYLGQTPTPVHTLRLDHNSGYNGWTLGRWYHLLIQKPGYQDMWQWVFVPFTERHEDFAAKRPRQFHFILKPMYYVPPYQHSWQWPAHDRFSRTFVEITTDPSNSAVYIEDRYVGHSPCKVELVWDIYSPSRKRVRVERSGFSIAEKEIGLFENQVHLVLQPHRNHRRRY